MLVGQLLGLGCLTRAAKNHGRNPQHNQVVGLSVQPHCFGQAITLILLGQVFFDKVVIEGIAHYVGRIGKAHFLHQAGLVRAHGLNTDK